MIKRSAPASFIIFIKFLENRGIRNHISTIRVYIYSLELIIVDSNHTAGMAKKNRRRDYVDAIIYNLYVSNIWKIIYIWTEGSLGSIKTDSDRGILPADPDRHGSWWIDTSGISDSDHYRNRIPFG